MSDEAVVAYPRRHWEVLMVFFSDPFRRAGRSLWTKVAARSDPSLLFLGSALNWVRSYPGGVPRLAGHVRHRDGGCLGSSSVHRARKPSRRSAWACIRRTATGICCWIPYSVSLEPVPCPGEPPWLAYAVLDCFGNNGLRRYNSGSHPRE